MPFTFWLTSFEVLARFGGTGTFKLKPVDTVVFPLVEPFLHEEPASFLEQSSCGMTCQQIVKTLQLVMNS